MAENENPGVPGPLVGGPTPMPRRSRRRASWWRRLSYAIVAPIAVVLVRIVWGSYRYEVIGDEPATRLASEGEPLILTFWHENIFAMAPYLFRLGRDGARITFLVSPSVDGDLVARILGIMGGKVLRGSATRSGVKAMKGLYRAIVRDHGSPVVLPDGPQGPRRHCKPGSLLLAGMSGARIQPMTCTASAAWRLRTWDRMVLPVPFAKVIVVLGDSYTVPSGLSADELEQRRRELERRLVDLEPQHTTGEAPRP